MFFGTAVVVTLNLQACRYCFIVCLLQSLAVLLKFTHKFWWCVQFCLGETTRYCTKRFPFHMCEFLPVCSWRAGHGHEFSEEHGISPSLRPSRHQAVACLLGLLGPPLTDLHCLSCCLEDCFNKRRDHGSNQEMGQSGPALAQKVNVQAKMHGEFASFRRLHAGTIHLNIITRFHNLALCSALAHSIYSSCCYYHHDIFILWLWYYEN